MSNEDRIKAILAKIEAAAEAKRKSNEEAGAMAATAAQKKMKIEAAWAPLRNHLEEFVRTMNGKLPDHLKLSVNRSQERHNDLIEALELTMDPESMGRSPRRSVVQVAGTGDISVQIGSRSQTPVKEYQLQSLTATPDEVERIVLDFIEANYT